MISGHSKKLSPGNQIVPCTEPSTVCQTGSVIKPVLDGFSDTVETLGLLQHETSLIGETRARKASGSWQCCSCTCANIVHWYSWYWVSTQVGNYYECLTKLLAWELACTIWLNKLSYLIACFEQLGERLRWIWSLYPQIVCKRKKRWHYKTDWMIKINVQFKWY